MKEGVWCSLVLWTFSKSYLQHPDPSCCFFLPTSHLAAGFPRESWRRGWGEGVVPVVSPGLSRALVASASLDLNPEAGLVAPGMACEP